ncbi:MAG: toxin HipA [Spartobacteria bacterium]|nr:toxin HipA [Spartobacteria bacterium]
MRKAMVFMHECEAGVLVEHDEGMYSFEYAKGYDGAPISRTLPVRAEAYTFEGFPSVFDGWLPEGLMLEALLRSRKIDRQDYFSQLLAVGTDLVGAVQVTSMDGDDAERGDG